MDIEPKTGKQITPSDGTVPAAVSREHLYEEVWAAPMTKVAQRYGVSGSFLARVCAQLSIPRPGRGYWARLAVGMITERPSLPAALPGDLVEWAPHGGTARVADSLPTPPPKHRRRSRQNSPNIARTGQHPLLSEVSQVFLAGRQSMVGFLKPAKRLLPDINVSKDTLPKALAVGNELFQLLEERGYKVALAPSNSQLGRREFDERERGGAARHYSDLWRPWRPTVVHVGTVAIGITLFELTEDVPARWKDGKYVRLLDCGGTKRGSPLLNEWVTTHNMPSGRLCVQAYSPYSGTDWQQQWRETKPDGLSRQLASIVKTLERKAGEIAELVEIARRKAAEEHDRWSQQFEKWKREQTERERQKAVEDSREDLMAAINAWREARQIEDFLSEIEQACNRTTGETRVELLDRLLQARRLLGEPDAIGHLLRWRTPNERLS